MISLEDNILITGLGSVGERHVNNLLNLGFKNIYAYRERNLPLRTVDPQKIKFIFDFSEVAKINPKIAFICSPTSFHIKQAIKCAENNTHLFIEKPLSHNFEDIEKLKEIVIKNNLYVKVGYMLRFHPLLIKLKKFISEKTFGELISFTTRWGEYLPDWHKWEDYRISYAAKKDLGGGASLTLSHDIDLMNWLIESPLDNHYSIKNYSPNLEVDVESGVDFIIKYKNGVTGHINLNFYEKPSKRYLYFVFENATLYFDYIKSAIIIEKDNFSETIKLENFDRNQLFMDELKDLFEKIRSFDINESVQNIEESELIIKMCTF